MTSTSPRDLHAAAVTAAIEELQAAERAYKEARQRFEQRAAQLQDELVGPARRDRLRKIQTLAELTSAEEVGRVLGFTGGRARQLMAEARKELGSNQSTLDQQDHSR